MFRTGNAGDVNRAAARCALPVLAAAVVSAVAPGAAVAGTAACAGATGAGDPYFPGYGNGGYNVRHYDLDLDYDPATDELDGRARIDAKAKQRLCSFNLDLAGLEVSTVEVDGKGAAWTRSGQELTVTPRRPLENRARFRVAVSYAGVPEAFRDPVFGDPIGFTTTSDGAIAVGQPESAAAWFPVNDHPRDKASYSFEVAVPDGYEVVANGKPHGQEPRPDGWTVWRWEAREPMASYLATVDIGQWDVVRWRTESGIPVYDAVDPAIPAAIQEQVYSSLARQGEILDLFAERFGPYPFSTVGGIVDPERPIQFALETQTRPVYSSIFWLDDQGNPTNADFVVAHELAHQWYGDSVALDRWQDIWLNEGFATYAEFLWGEHEGGATTRQIFDAAYAIYPADDPLWSVVIGDPGPDQLLDLAVYVRGGMTLVALQEEIGDEAFWTLLRGWAQRKERGGHGTTEEFISLAEEISNRQLDSLFETWLFTAGKPPPLAAARPAAARRPTRRQLDPEALAWLERAQARLRIGSY
jgi:aminopeptidase N